MPTEGVFTDLEWSLLKPWLIRDMKYMTLAAQFSTPQT